MPADTSGKYRNRGGMHAYYVPDTVRQLAGGERLDSLEGYCTEDETVDWAKVREMIPSATLIKEVEADTLAGVGGNVGRERRPTPDKWESHDAELTVPRAGHHVNLVTHKNHGHPEEYLVGPLNQEFDGIEMQYVEQCECGGHVFRVTIPE